MSKIKDGPEQQMPGQNFSSGNITLFQIAESKGKKLGEPQLEPANTIVSDRDKAILATAIPAKRFERVLRSVSAQAPQNKPEIGKIMLHKPTGNKVKIVKLNVGKSFHGATQHLVKIEGSSDRFKVKEENLV